MILKQVMSRYVLTVLGLLVIFFSSFLIGEEKGKEQVKEQVKEQGKVKDNAFVPIYFSTETMGNTFGAAGIAKAVGQPQAALFGMALYSDKNSYVGFFSAYNYALSDSLLFSTQMYQARFNDSPYYIGAQGSNNSAIDDKTFTNGLEQNLKLEFKYLLPWGSVAEHGLRGVFKPTKNVSFASPLKSGISSIIFTPFYTSRKLDILSETEQATGFSLAFDWDNRDNTRNPTKGSHTNLAFITGADNWANDDLWRKWTFQNSQYFMLGPMGDVFDQQVIALDFYTADTPTWNNCNDELCARPPEMEQARLGGLYRLRSYTSGRYHSRSAIHYSAEYRVTPKWQPLEDLPVIDYYDLPWWQWVAFAEIGRVADEYDLKSLHTDMQWSLGLAARFQVEGIVVRAEFATASDENAFRVMINQPF